MMQEAKATPEQRLWSQKETCVFCWSAELAGGGEGLKAVP